MHFLIWEILSFNLIYVAACYLVGTGMCHNMVGLLQHYINMLGLPVKVLEYSSFISLQCPCLFQNYIPHFEKQ